MHSLHSIKLFLDSKDGRMGVEIPKAIMARAEEKSIHGSLLIPDHSIGEVMGDEAITHEFLVFAKKQNPPREPYVTGHGVNQTLD